MFLRCAFTEFLTLQSDAAPLVVFDWVIDWRWFGE